MNAFIQQAHVTLIIIREKMDSTEILSSTTVFNIIIIRIVSWVNQHIRKISEGSCDIQFWSNDAEIQLFQ